MQSILNRLQDHPTDALIQSLKTDDTWFSQTFFLFGLLCWIITVSELCRKVEAFFFKHPVYERSQYYTFHNKCSKKLSFNPIPTGGGGAFLFPPISLNLKFGVLNG